MDLKDVKKQFYAYRNGMLADRLRSAGDCHSVIFGLNLPQIVEISKSIGNDKNLSEQLWANSTTRESRLLAPMIYPVAEFSETLAKVWIEGLENTEVVDVFCHRLLRRSEYAENESDILRYFAMRLALNLIIIGKISDMAYLKSVAEREMQRNCTLTKGVANSILEEFE